MNYSKPLTPNRHFTPNTEMMEIKLYITKEQALTAIAHSLSFGEPIKSKKAFRNEIATYFQIYGLSCMDDHQSESSESFDEAQLLVDKYYKP